MKHSIEESRGSNLAHWTAAFALALGAWGCASSDSSHGSRGRGARASADLAAEVDALTDELTQRASLRIPLGSARVFVDEPIAVRPESKRYWPAHWVADEWRATQAALELELQFALANRMNVVGPHRHSREMESGAGVALAGLDAHDADDAHANATHALITTFVHDGDDLELKVQLVECDSGWIVATARRRIVGWSPRAHVALMDAPRPVAAIVRRADVAHAAGRPTPERVASGGAPSATLVATSERAVNEGLGSSGEPAMGDSELALVDWSDGPAAMRRRALERIANEVACRIADETQ